MKKKPTYAIAVVLYARILVRYDQTWSGPVDLALSNQIFYLGFDARRRRRVHPGHGRRRRGLRTPFFILSLPSPASSGRIPRRSHTVDDMCTRVYLRNTRINASRLGVRAPWRRGRTGSAPSPPPNTHAHTPDPHGLTRHPPLARGQRSKFKQLAVHRPCTAFLSADPSPRRPAVRPDDA